VTAPIFDWKFSGSLKSLRGDLPVCTVRLRAKMSADGSREPYFG
jgi:hypothetical protein